MAWDPEMLFAGIERRTVVRRGSALHRFNFPILFLGFWINGANDMPDSQTVKSVSVKTLIASARDCDGLQLHCV
jgi:hypothetical protein